MSPVRKQRPEPTPDEPEVELVWLADVDHRRLKRVAGILADILDNARTPDERRRR